MAFRIRWEVLLGGTCRPVIKAASAAAAAGKVRSPYKSLTGYGCCNVG